MSKMGRKTGQSGGRFPKCATQYPSLLTNVPEYCTLCLYFKCFFTDF